MAKLYAAADGTFLRFEATLAEEQAYGAPPTFVTVLDFDEDENLALIADVRANRDHYRLLTVAGLPSLQKDGVPVVVVAADSYYGLRAAVLNGFTDAQIKAAAVALWNGTATNAQVQKALGYLVAKARIAGII